MKKTYSLIFGTVLAIASANFCVYAEYPADLDGIKMAMSYRADNWDMFTNVKVDKVTFRKITNLENAYRLDGFMGWYNNLYLLDSPLAKYDAEKGLLTIESMQDVIARDEITWQINNVTRDDEINEIPIMFQMDNEGIFRHVAKPRYNGTIHESAGFIITADGGYDAEAGEQVLYTLYQLLDPVIHPYNGKMSYSFVAQNGKEYAQESVVYTFVHGNNLIVRNWSDTGFDYDIFFTIDAQNHTVTATNQAALFDPDMLDECTLCEADANGEAVLTITKDYVLEGTYTAQTIDGKEQTVISFPTWGCFNEYNRNFFVPTTNTKLYLGYDIANPPAAVNEAYIAAPNDVPEYYTLEGIRVDKPAKGLYIVRKDGKTSKIIIK